MRATFQSAMSMLKEERYEPGIALLLKITEKMPSLTAAHIDLGMAYARTGDLDRAEGSLNKAFHVIGATASKYRLIANRTEIRKAWESHRSVAHLGVGFLWLLGSARPIPRL